MKRGAPLKRTTPLRRGRGFQASPEQREKMTHAACVVTGRDRHECVLDPAHVIPRSMGGCDHPDCVVPLARHIHYAYDQGEFDLLPYLEQHRRPELAHAVSHVGLIAALERITNERWTPYRIEREDAA